MLLSERQDLVHQRKLHSAATERLQSRIDDLQVQVSKLVQTLDRNCTTAKGMGTVDTRISRLPRPCFLSLANSLTEAHKSPTPYSQLWRSYALRTTHGLTNIMRRGMCLCQFF